MADDDKTEEPTSKKISDARKKGNVPKSSDTSAVIVLLVALVSSLALFPFIRENMVELFRYYFSLIGMHLNRDNMIDLAIITAKYILLMVLPLAGIVAMTGIIAAVSQFGFLFTTESMKFDLTKISPLKGLKNLISIKKLIDGIKVMFKSFIVLGVGFILFFDAIKELPTVALFSLGDQIRWVKEQMIVIGSAILFIIFLFALVDLIITRKRYHDGLKMTKQEVKDEFKNAEGDPLIKSKIRQKQMEMAAQRMMSSVPQADVVITNPTHYAVAIKYDEAHSHAPIVTAKGMDVIAQQIKKIARENNVHIVQNPPLARSLYNEVEVDQPIPETLFHAVAEVLAYVYKMNKK